MILIYIKRQHTSNKTSWRNEAQKNHIRWWWSFFFVHIYIRHMNHVNVDGWKEIDKQRSWASIVSDHGVFCRYFFSSLSSVQYSKQSSSTIAYTSTVRNGRSKLRTAIRKTRNVSSVNWKSKERKKFISLEM